MFRCDIILFSSSTFWASSTGGHCDDSQSLGLWVAHHAFGNQRKSQEEEEKNKSKCWWFERKGAISNFARICSIALFNWWRQYFPRCQVYPTTLSATCLISWFVRYHPQDRRILFSVINSVPPRTRKTRTVTRQAFICIWNTETWVVEKTKKVGDRGLTCFDVRYEAG